MEISKLSLEQVNQLKRKTIWPEAAATSKSIRVLICQQAHCRQRGSLAVSQAMKEAILQGSAAEAEAGSPEIVVRATGCLKRCKAGPNVVVSGEVHTGVTPEEGRSLIQSAR